MKRQTVTAIIVLTVLLVSMLTSAFNIQRVKAEPETWIVDDDGPADFTTIQSAIDSPLVVDGDTIFVKNGIYYENVVIHKRVSLVGEDRSLTIIDGCAIDDVVTIEASNTEVCGFTIQDSGLWYNAGIEVRPGSNGNTLSHNIIKDNDYAGIILFQSSGNTVSENIIDHWYFGLHIYLSSNNIISQNNITSPYGYMHTSYGIGIETSSYNVFSGNNILNNQYPGGAGVEFVHAANNTFYNNNFINNTKHVAFWPYDETWENIWDNDYPAGGNYWDDFIAVDLCSGPNQDEPGSDGIWDHPYIIDEINRDNYPLVEPWSPVEPDFEITVSPSSQSVDIPQSVEYEITVSSLNGFSSQVTLDVSIAPLADYGTHLDDAYLTPPPNGEAQTTLRFNTYPNTPPQTYEITVNGASEGIEKSDTASLNVYIVKGIETIVTINEFTVEPSKKTNLLFTIQQNFLIPIAFDGDQITRFYIVQNAIAVMGKPGKYKMAGLVNIWEYKWGKSEGDPVAYHYSQGDYKNEVVMRSIIQDSTLKLENDFLNFTHNVPASSFIHTTIAEIVIVAPGQKGEEKTMSVKFVEPTSGHIAAHFLLGSNDWVNGKMCWVYEGETLTRETSEGLTCHYIGVGIFEAIVPSPDHQGFRIWPDHDSPL